MTPTELKTKVTETFALTQAQITEIVAKVKAWPTWKKALCIVAALIITHGAVGLGLYIAGTKQNDHVDKPTITKDESKDKGKVYPPVDKNSVCGTKIEMIASIERYKEDNLTIKVFGKDKCKEYTSYYDVKWACPVYKWGIGIMPGLFIHYSVDQKKVTPMIGGGLYFKRYYGKFSVGPMLSYYQDIGSKEFSVGANLILEYKF